MEIYSKSLYENNEFIQASLYTELQINIKNENGNANIFIFIFHEEIPFCEYSNQKKFNTKRVQ